MSRYLIAPAARLDLLAIWNYFALEIGDIDLADRFSASAKKTFEVLARAPGLGRSRPFGRESLKDIRSWRVEGFSRYLVFYRATKTPIEIVRVIHGARNLPRLFAVES